MKRAAQAVRPDYRDCVPAWSVWTGRAIENLNVDRLEAGRYRRKAARQRRTTPRAVCPCRSWPACHVDYKSVGNYPSACSRSAMRSAGDSRPTERRSRSGGQGVPAPSTLARCSIRLSTPPSEVARFQISTLAAVRIAAASPALIRTDNMPPNPPCICLAATAWPRSDCRPG